MFRIWTLRISTGSRLAQARHVQRVDVGTTALALTAFFTGQPSVTLKLTNCGNYGAATGANLARDGVDAGPADTFIAGEISQARQDQQLRAFDSGTRAAIPHVR